MKSYPDTIDHYPKKLKCNGFPVSPVSVGVDDAEALQPHSLLMPLIQEAVQPLLDGVFVGWAGIVYLHLHRVLPAQRGPACAAGVLGGFPAKRAGGAPTRLRGWRWWVDRSDNIVPRRGVGYAGELLDGLPIPVLVAVHPAPVA